MPPLHSINDKNYPYYYNQNLNPHNPINPNSFPQTQGGSAGSK